MSVFRLPEGMSNEIFMDRYSRIGTDGLLQDYESRMREVVEGNFTLGPKVWTKQDYDRTMELAVSGVMPTSGRHIQHGDKDQSSKRIEMFTNCSTCCFSFMNLILLLNGSGVGRDYSSRACRTNWDYLPSVRIVLNGGSDDSGSVEMGSHKDFNDAREEFRGSFDSLREAQHKYPSESEMVRWIKVKDSREGWAEVLAILETAAFHKNHEKSLFIFDFSDIRPKGSPIAGMQGRPAQGPIPLMRAIAKAMTIKGAQMKPWKQALFIDDVFADCVVMGDVRRAARMATKIWTDDDIIEFVEIKRGGFLRTANNSVLVDEEFWAQARLRRPSHARRVFEAVVGSQYFDYTGEPGFINVDKLHWTNDGVENITSQNYINPSYGMDLHPKTFEMIDNVLRHIKKSKYVATTNPCGEIVLAQYGGYCIIGDVCLEKAQSLKEAEDAVSLMSPFLMRVNYMEAIYGEEVKRTNRIGVSLTGIHEFAWRFFKCGFKDLILMFDFLNGDTEIPPKVKEFWYFIDSLRRRAEVSAISYAEDSGSNIPHTVTTIKPSGTISKVMWCTEGAHLPSQKWYMRWVSKKKNSELHLKAEKEGYPIKDVSHQYRDTVVIGFPTCLGIVSEMPENDIVTATEASPEDNFKWVYLLEKYWIGGSGVNNQISYTLKYDPSKVSYDDFMQMILDFQPRVKCCTTMPISDLSAFAYQPEEPLTKEQYDYAVSRIKNKIEEVYEEDELVCASGACPIDQVLNIR